MWPHELKRVRQDQDGCNKKRKKEKERERRQTADGPTPRGLVAAHQLTLGTAISRGSLWMSPRPHLKYLPGNKTRPREITEIIKTVPREAGWV